MTSRRTRHRVSFGAYFGVCLGLCGCAQGLPTAPGALVADVAADRNLERQIRAALRDENNLLLFLSRGRSGGMPYGCGDDRDPRFRQIAKDDVITNKAILAAVDLITSYSAALDHLKDRDQRTQAALGQLKTAVGAAGAIPGAAGYAAGAALSIGLLSKTAAQYTTWQARVTLAQYMGKGLDAAIDLLEKNTTALRGTELIAFRLWDACARETLAYIRDVPLGRVVIKNNNTVYPAYVAQSSGVELKNAYTDYLTQRAAFRSKVPKFHDDLEQIRTQNTGLASGQISADDLSQFIGLLAETGQEAQTISKTVAGSPDPL